jgi:hypothetical protein
MDLHEALKEVLDAAKQPKQFPSGAKRVPLATEVLVTTVSTEQIKGRAWHESLTPAQKTVCRWIWETCVQYDKPWEAFEGGFLCEYNVNHELAVWARIAHVFSDFLKRHPSVNKREILGDLLQLSAGVSVKRLKNRRAKELADLWKQGASE